MKVFIFLVSLALSQGYEIKATGGGVVTLGSDLELTLEVGKVWDRCRWFVYEHHADYQWCSYDLDAESGNATQHKCSNEEVSHIMTYTGNDPKACTITVFNVTDDYDCQWAARLDEDLQNSVINITVAHDVLNVTIEAESDLVAGQNGKLTCKIYGGRPAPSVNFEFEKPAPQLTNDSMSQVEENGLMVTVQEVNFMPDISDNGKQVTCEAYVMDNDGHALFNKTSAHPKFYLDVKFPPQPEENQTLSGNKTENITISFEFQANPQPTEIKWIVSIPEVVNAANYSHLRNESAQVIELTPGHDDDKYLVEDLVSLEEMRYEASMTIFDLQDADHDDLYFLQVSNQFGTQKYFFEIKVNDENDNGDDQDHEHGGQPMKTSVGIVVVILIGIALLCAIFYIVYKRNQIHNETAPLATMESRRN